MMNVQYSSIATATNGDMIETYTVESLVFADNLASAIDDCRAVDGVSETQWEKIAEFSRGMDTPEQWLDRVERAEENNLTTRKADGEEFNNYSNEECKRLGVVSTMTKAGKPIARACFGKSWCDYKGIVRKALEHGVDLFDEDGNVKAKGKLAKEYGESDTADKAEKSAADKMQTVLNAYKGLYAQLTGSEQEDCRKLIENIHNTGDNS